MNAYLRHGAIAIALLGSVGLAAAQSYPKGAPGVNDNMMVSPADLQAAQPYTAPAAATQSYPKGAPGVNDNMMVMVPDKAAQPVAQAPVHKHKKHASTAHKHKGT